MFHCNTGRKPTERFTCKPGTNAGKPLNAALQCIVNNIHCTIPRQQHKQAFGTQQRWLQLWQIEAICFSGRAGGRAEWDCGSWLRSQTAAIKSSSRGNVFLKTPRPTFLRWDTGEFLLKAPPSSVALLLVDVIGTEMETRLFWSKGHTGAGSYPTSESWLEHHQSALNAQKWSVGAQASQLLSKQLFFILFFLKKKGHWCQCENA